MVLVGLFKCYKRRTQFRRHLAWHDCALETSPKFAATPPPALICHERTTRLKFTRLEKQDTIQKTGPTLDELTHSETLSVPQHVPVMELMWFGACSVSSLPSLVTSPGVGSANESSA
jgi:hypothetical protein